MWRVVYISYTPSCSGSSYPNRWLVVKWNMRRPDMQIACAPTLTIVLMQGSLETHSACSLFWCHWRSLDLLRKNLGILYWDEERIGTWLSWLWHTALRSPIWWVCWKVYSTTSKLYFLKGSYSYTFQYAAGSLGWSFVAVGYLAYFFSPFLLSPTAWILDEWRVRDYRYFSNAHLAK